MEGGDSFQCLFSVLVSKFFSCVTVELMIQLMVHVLMLLHLPGPDHFISQNTLSRLKWEVIWNCSKGSIRCVNSEVCLSFPASLVEPIYFKGSFSTISLLPCESISHSVISDSATPWTVACQGTQNSPGKNTGVGSPSLLQRIFPSQVSNPGLLHCRQMLYHLSHQGSLLIL